MLIVIAGGFPTTSYGDDNPPGCTVVSEDVIIYLLKAFPPLFGAFHVTVSCPRCPGVVV